MTTPLETYRRALQSARDDFDTITSRLRAIDAERETLLNDVTNLRRTITALSALCSEEPNIDKLGITECCMAVMERATGIMTTKDVVQGLKELGFDLDSHKNAVASVHSVLGRLAIAKKIERTSNVGGNTAWKGPNFDPDDIPF